MLAVLRGERPDRVPFTIYECMIPQCAVERRLRNEGLCIVNRWQEGYSSHTPNCAKESHTYTEGGRRLVRTVTHTPLGDISTVVQPAGFTNWTIEREFKGPEDYERLLFIVRDKVYGPADEAFRRAEEWMGEDVILRGGLGSNPLHRIMGWMGLETFAVEWHERRDEVLKLEAAMRERKREVYRIVADSPITHANYGGNEVPEVMGRERFRDFVLPLLQEAAEAFHAKGKLLGSHLDGNNGPWADLVAAVRAGLRRSVHARAGHGHGAGRGARRLAGQGALDQLPVLAAPGRHRPHQAGRARVRRPRAPDGPRHHRHHRGHAADRWQGNLLAISEVIND